MDEVTLTSSNPCAEGTTSTVSLPRTNHNVAPDATSMAESLRLARDDAGKKKASKLKGGVNPADQGTNDMDASEAESLRLAREDLEVKMASSPTAMSRGICDVAPNKSNDMDASEAESIRLARDDLQAKKASNPQMAAGGRLEDGELPADMDASMAESIRLARADLQSKFSSGAEGEAELARRSNVTQAPSQGCTQLPGAISVDGGSNHVTPLHPANLDSFGSSLSGVAPLPTHYVSDAASNPGGSNDPTPCIVEARLVDEEEDDGHSPNKEVLVSAEELVWGFSSRQIWGMGSCLTVVVVCCIAVVIVVLKQSSSNESPTLPPNDTPSLAPTTAPGTTMEQIRERGFIRCGIWKESLDFFDMAGIYEDREDAVDFLLVSLKRTSLLILSLDHQG